MQALEDKTKPLQRRRQTVNDGEPLGHRIRGLSHVPWFLSIAPRTLSWDVT
jgi:hypothetical protein